MAGFVPDFEQYWLKETFSDVSIVLYEEGAGKCTCRGKRKLEDSQTIPGHSMVLVSFSNVLKTKLENWSSASDSKHKIQLSVPSNQMRVGELLLLGMYQREPNITEGLSQEQLLQLLLLADRYEVPKVAAAVVAAFKATPVEQMQWDIALALLDIPLSCAGQEGFKSIQQLAVQRLLQQLGDLEVVWADKQLQQQLLTLPFIALLQLLQHDETCVASEHTVVYSILEWYSHQPTAAQDLEQLKQLMEQVRMQHCSQYYISTTMMHNELIRQCFTLEDLSMAMLCCSKDGCQLLRDTRCRQLHQYPSWAADQRPASRTCMKEWALDLRELEAAMREVNSGHMATVDGPMYVHQGRLLQLFTAAVILPDRPRPEPAKWLFVLVSVLDLDPQEIGIMSAQVAVITTSGADVGQSNAVPRCFSQQAKACACGLILQLDPSTDWPSVESALREKDLVHPDSCLHLKAEIFSIL